MTRYDTIEYRTFVDLAEKINAMNFTDGLVTQVATLAPNIILHNSRGVALIMVHVYDYNDYSDVVQDAVAALETTEEVAEEA
jgi:hypothetical protein